MGHPARRVMEVQPLSSRTVLPLVLCSLLASPTWADETSAPTLLEPVPSAATEPSAAPVEPARSPTAAPGEVVLEVATGSAEPAGIVLEVATASTEPGEIVLEVATASAEPAEVVPVVATASPSLLPVTVASGSPVPIGEATASVDPFAWRRHIPFDLVVDAGIEGLGQGNVSGLGFISRETAIAGMSIPGLERSDSNAAGGSWGHLEARLGSLALGLRGSILSVTPVTTGPYSPAFPERRWDCYARLGALSIGMRQETFGGSSILSGDYQSVFGGLDGTLLDLFGTVSLDYGLLAGWGTQKPRLVPSAVAHLPGEGHLELSIRLPWCTVRGGWRAVAVVNVDPIRAWGLLTDPGTLVPSGASEAIAATSGLSATSWSVYTGPYLRVGSTF